MEVRKQDYYKMIIGFLTFFMLGSYVVKFMRGILGMTLTNESMFDVALVDLVSSGLATIIITFLYRKVLIRDFKKLKKQYGGLFKYLRKVFVAFSLFFGIKFGVGIVETIVFQIAGVEMTSPENQNLINKIMAEYPAMMIISACFIAPIEEEVLYRCGIKQIIKNKKVFVTVSGLIFGLMHVTGSLTFLAEILLLGVVVSLIASLKLKKGMKYMLSLLAVVSFMLIFVGIYYYQYGNIVAIIKGLSKTELISSISYITMGGILAIFYQKEDNIYFTIGIHALNNILGVVLTLLF